VQHRVVESEGQLPVVVLMRCGLNAGDVADEARSFGQAGAIGQTRVRGGFGDDFIAAFGVPAIDRFGQLGRNPGGLLSVGRAGGGLCCGRQAQSRDRKRSQCEGQSGFNSDSPSFPAEDKNARCGGDARGAAGVDSTPAPRVSETPRQQAASGSREFEKERNAPEGD
jgi:hypothetical protein